MPNKYQDQEVSGSSTAIQAGGDVNITHNGLTYEEVKGVALDVFRANFYQLSGLAQDTARARAEEITESFLQKLQAEHEGGLQKANDPDFQFALFTVQREYARTGGKDLGDLLVDLLVDRSKQSQRGILQIVLNESLDTAPKLTDSQLAILAVKFLFGYTLNYGVVSHSTLAEYFDKYVSPFWPKLIKNLASFQHLEFCGCGTVSLGSTDLEMILGKTYRGIFVKGFDSTDVLALKLKIGLDQRFFGSCINDATKLQVRARNEEHLSQMFEQNPLEESDRQKIRQLFNKNLMSSNEIREKCIELRPYMATVFDCWANSAMKNFSLTSVGIAIGHANVKRFVGEFADLSVWIN